MSAIRNLIARPLERNVGLFRRRAAGKAATPEVYPHCGRYLTRRIDRIGVSEISLRKWAATTVSCCMIAERAILLTVVLFRVLSLPLSSRIGCDGNTHSICGTRKWVS